MDMNLTWLIIALFYAPLHYAIPLLVVLLRGAVSPAARRAALLGTAADCTVSMLLAFALVVWLAEERWSLAMGVLSASMAVPYVRLLVVRRPKAASIN